MRVTATGNVEEIPGKFFSLSRCSSPPTKMLLLDEKIQEWQGKVTRPGASLVSKLVKHSRAGIGHMDMLPDNSQAQFGSEDGPEMVLAKSQSHHSLEVEAL